jgi:phosphoribosylaminoimidazolecarboxamide formyltransferase / IMP cyclohydrolase
VKYIASPVGSQNDGPVFDAAEKLGVTFIEQRTRLFHH